MPQQNLPQISNSGLSFSYWYISHKLLIKKVLIAAGLLLAGAAWVFVFSQLYTYFINYTRGQQADIQLRQSFGAQWPGISQVKPQPLEISQSTVVALENQQYEYIDQMINPNDQWLAMFDYQFVDGVSTSTKRRGFLLPKERAYAVDANLPNPNAQLEITNYQWQRVDDFENAKADKLLFTIADQKITPAAEAHPAALSFTITNESIFSYWQVEAQIAVFSQGSLVTVFPVPISQLKGGEKRLVSVNSPTALSADSIEVLPRVNILDPKSFMPAGQ